MGKTDQSTGHCCRTDGITYTDVIIIGNGPSGISLSCLLSGYWPYYSGDVHPNEYLQMRLEKSDKDKSLIEQDLDYLSNGLEGRSNNPVALLLDSLIQPDADIGMELPSLLKWEQHPDRAIPHVVLGKKAAGGAWQMMDGEMQTLSLGNWMQLPDEPFKKWLEEYHGRLDSTSQNGTVPLNHNRASIKEVRTYYEEYVKTRGLEQYFRNHSTVTSVERVLDVHHAIDDESGEQKPCSNDHSGKLKWEVRGYETVTDDYGEVDSVEFCYRAPNVVLATGMYDKPNKLKVPGENNSYVLHSLSELEKAIKDGKLTPDSEPLVIVGAGLSASDSILYAQSCDIPVVHVFRRDVEDPNLIFRKLPKVLYPEYHKVHQMMKNHRLVDTGYHTYPMHNIVEFRKDKKVLVHDIELGCDTIVEASYVLVLIGVSPDLSFLPDNGQNLGIIPNMGIESKHNPMDIDPYSYQCVHECGMYAMGPLMGETFVRFLQGGALGITSHLWKKKQGEL